MPDTKRYDALLESLEAAWKDATRLDVVTEVENGGNTERIATTFDLLTGDVTTRMTGAFATGSLGELRAFHAEREKQGMEMVRQRVEALERLVAAVRELVAEAARGR